MKTKILHIVQLFWTLFIGIGAYFGAFMMFYDTSGKNWGMDAMLPYFQVLPFANVLFQNFIFPGIALLVLIGITNTIAFVLLVRKNRYGNVAGMICGLILMAWICIQFFIFEKNIMSAIYFVFGILQVLTGVFAMRKK